MEPTPTSHRVLWIILGIVAILVVAVFAFAWFSKTPAPVQGVATTTGAVTLPAASTTQYLIGGGASTTTPATIAVGSTGSTSIVVQDFIHNGITVEEPQNPGIYVLQGPTGYCADGSCPQAGLSENFRIEYDATSTTFNIALTEEPIGPARIAAEQFLQQVLGITQPGLCMLRYYLGTSVQVNETFAGKNLGFSFCPGATQLPSN